MAFVQAKCVNCGGILTVDPDLKTAACPHCGVTYVVEDSIKYYNSVTKVEHLHADVVNIADEKSSEGLLAAADAYVKIGKFKLARDKYEQATALAPQNWRGWCGLIVSVTHNFEKRIQSRGTLMMLEDYARSAEAFSTDGECNRLIKRYKEYESAQKDLNKKEISELRDSVRETENKLQALGISERDCRSSIEQANVDKSVMENKISDIRHGAVRPVSRAVISADIIVSIFLKIFIKGLLGLKALVLLPAVSLAGVLIHSHVSEHKLVRALREIDGNLPQWSTSADSIKKDRISLEHEKESLLETLKAYE